MFWFSSVRNQKPLFHKLLRRLMVKPSLVMNWCNKLDRCCHGNWGDGDWMGWTGSYSPITEQYFILHIPAYSFIIEQRAPQPGLARPGPAWPGLWRHGVPEAGCAPLLMLKGMLTFWIHVVFPQKAPRIVLINPSGWTVPGSSSSTLLSDGKNTI